VLNYGTPNYMCVFLKYDSIRSYSPYISAASSVLLASIVPHFLPLSTSPGPAVSCAEMGSFSEKNEEILAHKSIDTDQVDTGAQLVAGISLPLDSEESLSLRYGPT
jgi:hypothetical protein